MSDVDRLIAADPKVTDKERRSKAFQLGKEARVRSDSMVQADCPYGSRENTELFWKGWNATNKALRSLSK